MSFTTAIIAVVMAFFGFAGGGGSSSGGGGGSSSGGSSYSSYSSSSSSSSDDSELTPFEAVLACGIFLLVIISIISTMKKSPSFKDHNSTAAEKQIHMDAERIFRSYQEDWSNFNLEDIKTFTTDQYFAHASLMLELLKNMHRANKVSKLKVRKVYLLTPVKDDTPLPAKVQIKFAFAGLDEVIDDDGSKLYSQYASGLETWNFIYDGQNLKLDGISQPTESAPHLVKSLADFAKENQLFYSPDWGRYALPSRGLIFGGASMKIADINNHVIGKWGDLLIQLYSYAERPDQALSSYYIVGQINVPKDYLGVVVKSKKFKTFKKPAKTYEKFEMEWGEFNDRYDVYAASRDALPAFELLNPKFMEFLYSKNPSYNLEVVDNVIYIYANVRNVTEKDYTDMLEVLRKAYDELKM